MGVSIQFTPGFRLIDGTDLNSLVQQINTALDGIGPQSGPVYFVNSTIGNDGQLTPAGYTNNGQNPATPLATIDRALAIERAALLASGLSTVGRNAVIAFWGTIHTTATIAWNLPATHLVGIDNGLRRGQRARISPASGHSTTGWDNLVKVTAEGCLFQNFQAYYGFDNTPTALIAWYDTAGHSTYNNVEFLGFGSLTASTGTQDLTGARAFKMNTSTGESTFINCVFGPDTVTRNVTNYTVEIAGGAPRLHFENCTFEAYLGASGGSSSHVLIGAAGIDRYIKFKSCNFLNSVNSGGTAMAQLLNVSGSSGGTLLLDQCISTGMTALQTTPTTNNVMNMTLATTGGGIAHEVF